MKMYGVDDVYGKGKAHGGEVDGGVWGRDV